MATFDVRVGGVDAFDDTIVFGDYGESLHIEKTGFTITQALVISKREAEALIRAINKAIELGWFDE